MCVCVCVCLSVSLHIISSTYHPRSHLHRLQEAYSQHSAGLKLSLLLLLDSLPLNIIKRVELNHFSRCFLESLIALYRGFLFPSAPLLLLRGKLLRSAPAAERFSRVVVPEPLAGLGFALIGNLIFSIDIFGLFLLKKQKTGKLIVLGVCLAAPRPRSGNFFVGEIAIARSGSAEADAAASKLLHRFATVVVCQEAKHGFV